eukprot:gene3883-20106_t
MTTQPGRNVLLHAKNQIKISDFGLARRYNTTTPTNGYKLVTKMKIPFKWCPPECLPAKLWAKTKEGRKGSYQPLFNEASDMWAFGVVLWEIASYGKVPFGNANLVKTLENIHAHGMRLEFPADASAALVSLAKRAHATDAGDRPSFATIEAEMNEKLAPLNGEFIDVGRMLNSNLETELKAISTTQVKKRRKSFKSFRTGGSGLAAHKEEPDDGGTGAGAGAGSAERGGSEGPVGGRGIARKPPSSIKLDDPSDVQSLGEAIGIGRAAFFNPDGWTVDEASGTLKRRASTQIRSTVLAVSAALKWGSNIKRKRAQSKKSFAGSSRALERLAAARLAGDDDDGC